MAFKLSSLINVLANIQKLREDPVLRAQFEAHLKSKGREFANHWLDHHAAEAGFNPAAVEAMKKELNK